MSDREFLGLMAGALLCSAIFLWWIFKIFVPIWFF